MPPRKKQTKPKINIATSIGDAYREGYIDGLEEQANWIARAEKILNWIVKTPIEERIDFLVDSEIQRYFKKKRQYLKEHIGRLK